MQDLQNSKDHLFISYATEDWPLASWLALKLTAEGYKVWCDRYKLLGGESYPRDIDKAIREKTFRFIGLLSKNSLNKENPLKERTLALNISRERKIDFFIPINVDGLKSTELGWMNSDLTYISFNLSWAEGLKQLLKKLESLQTPVDSKEKGMLLASKAFLDETNKEVKEEQEIIHSNIVKVSSLPQKLKVITSKTLLDRNNIYDLRNEWVAYFVDPFTLISFETPPSEISEEIGIEKINEIDWLNNEQVEGISTQNVMKYLINKSIESKLLKLGLVISKESKKLYFPFGLLKNDKIKFVNHKGRKTYVMATGLRNTKSPGKEYRYHLAPVFKPIIENQEIFIQVGIQLHITNSDFEEFKPKTALRKRKKICKDWWNREWLSRHQAVLGFLSDKDGKIIIGSKDSEINLENSFLKFNADKRLIESSKSLILDKMTREEIIKIGETEDE